MSWKCQWCCDILPPNKPSLMTAKYDLCSMNYQANKDNLGSSLATISVSYWPLDTLLQTPEWYADLNIYESEESIINSQFALKFGTQSATMRNCLKILLLKQQANSNEMNININVCRGTAFFLFSYPLINSGALNLSRGFVEHTQTSTLGNTKVQKQLLFMELQ